MKYFLLIGSSRRNSQSAKVGSYVARAVRQRSDDNVIYSLSLEDNPLPLWDEAFQCGTGKSIELWNHHAAEIAASEAVIVVTPEWSGMVPSAVKNVFLWCTGGELAHKPALIVALSATRGGSYPVAELRMSSYKNTKICYIPEHVIVHHVNDVLNGDEPRSDSDRLIRRRIAFGLGVLEAYGNALGQVRSHATVVGREFRFGM